MSTSISPPGARIGKYVIVSHIASGGMGSVYKARDPDGQRLVALKILSPELAKNPILVERFRREAMTAARLSHKNIVPLLGYGCGDGLHYLVMEFIDGFDLAEYIHRRGRLDPVEARRILMQACKALEHAFAQGITHRDIKPSNFLLASEAGRCRVKLTDLGLARTVNEDDFRVTKAGTTVGTVDYMAPEQARDSGLADVRSDIYSLGCTFYHMLAGHPPFTGGGIGQRVYQHLAADPPDVRQFNPEVTPELWAVLRRMLAKRPEDRYQTPTELLEALLALRRPTSASAPSRRPAGTADRRGDSDAEEEAAPPAPPWNKPPTPAPASAEGGGFSRSEKPPRPRKKRDTQPVDRNTLSEAAAALLAVTAEQRSAAAAQYTRATEVVSSGGDSAYALQLLLSCCKLDPANLQYRKTLREVGREAAGGKRGGLFGSLSNLPARGRMKAARHAGDHRKVLEHGEELLARLPGDVSTQLEMADSAEALGLLDLAVWLLEEASRQAPREKAVLRALALVYEQQKRFTKAISLWEQIRRVDPSDDEAATMIRNLSVSDTLARGNFRS